VRLRKLGRWADKYAIIRAINDIIDRINRPRQIRINGASVKQSQESVNIWLPEFLSLSEYGFWALIGANASDGTNRWKYAWQEAQLTEDGYGNWQAKTNGRSGTTGTNPARNTLENMNSGTGTQGNGVDAANLDTADYTFTIQPCPNGAIVWIRPVRAADGAMTYWFQYANGVDGGCD